MRKVVFLLAVILSLAACSAFAAPSFRGYTGLVKIPTADVLGEKDWNFGVTSEDAGHNFDLNNIFANYAPTENLEIGFNAFMPRGDNQKRETLLNAKYQLMKETEKTPAIAFGVTDITDQVKTSPYAVLSKSLGNDFKVFDSEVTGIRGHVGIGGGDFESVFLGVSAYVSKYFNVSAEWDSDKINFGISIVPLKGLRIHSGWFDPAGDNKIGLGLSYTMNY